MKWVWAIFQIWAATPAYANEIRELYFNPRVMAMGGAYTALADDEAAVFLNPAGLGGNQAYQVHWLAGTLDISSDLVSTYQSNAAAFSEAGLTTAENFYGVNLYLRAQYSPSLLIPNFGIAGLIDAQGGYYAKNRALPRITFGMQNTNGVQTAFGFSLFRERSRRRPASELRIGFGPKMMSRRGGYFDLNITELFELIDYTGFVSKTVGSYKTGFGLDLGMQYILRLGRRTQWSLGAAFRNVGTITFASPAAPIHGNLVVGAGFVYMPYRYLGVKFAYDFDHILESIDWRRKNHLGAEIILPFLSLYLGIHQTYLTGGLTFELFGIKMTALTYATEMGAYVNQDPNRRYMLTVDVYFEI